MTRNRNDAVCIFAPVTLLTVTLELTADGEDELHVHPGGQGVWVARMVSTLGGTATLCTPLGGETGSVIGHLLAEEGIALRDVPCDRANAAWIQDRRRGERETLWEAPSPTLGRHELDELYSVALAEAMDAGVCVLAGPHEQKDVLPDEVYTRLSADLASAGVKVVVDLSGGPLRGALAGGVYLVKVSDEELVDDGWAPDRELPSLLAGIDRLLAAGAERVVVSRAESGSIAALGNERLVVEPPELEAADTRGAGDSMTAALAYATVRGLEWSEALRLAAAAGAMNVTRHGSGSGRPETIARLAERTTVSALQVAAG